MLNIRDRVAYRIVALGADIISTGSHLSETGNAARAVEVLGEATEQLRVVKLAAAALERGDEEYCMRLLNSMSRQTHRDTEVISPAILDALELPS